MGMSQSYKTPTLATGCVKGSMATSHLFIGVQHYFFDGEFAKTSIIFGKKKHLVWNKYHYPICSEKIKPTMFQTINRFYRWKSSTGQSRRTSIRRSPNFRKLSTASKAARRASWRAWRLVIMTSHLRILYIYMNIMCIYIYMLFVNVICILSR